MHFSRDLALFQATPFTECESGKKALRHSKHVSRYFFFCAPPSIVVIEEMCL